MKKIAICSLLVGLSMVSNAYSECNPNNVVTYAGAQKPEWDIFLYMNESEYKKSKSGWENSKHQNSGDGHAAECDSHGLFTASAGCGDSDVIRMPAGHVFKGEVITEEREYRCDTPWGGAKEDRWTPITTFNICSTKWGDLKVDESYKGKTTIDCSGLAKTEDNVGLVKTWEVVCRQGPYLVCKPYECITGYTVDVINGKCVLDEQQQQPQICTQGTRHPDPAMLTLINACNGQNCSLDVNQCYPDAMLDCLAAAVRGEPANWTGNSCNCGSVSGKSYTWDTNEKKCVNNTVKKSCKESRSTVNGKACCDVPSNEAKYDAKTDKCNCLNDKEFKIDANGRGQCVVKEQRQQNEEPCYYNYTGYIRCPNGNNFSLIMKQYKLEKSDLEGKSCDEFKRLYENDVNASETLRAKICAEKQSAVVVNVPVGPSETQIKDARDTLKTFAANAESNASGWKTAEGKFNTTRLASDLTAGVVLGTVGGVVSGVVIKKKQVEKGFDALHCAVGGQKIADWGDTFSVGLQR